MLDNVTKDMANEFLLSLNLIDEKLSDKEKIRKLYTLSNNIEKNYKKTVILKKDGNKRIIYEPNYTLKKVQRNILDNVLSGFKVSKYAMAYVKGKSVKDNANMHVNKKLILKLDIKDFFNNISFMDVYNKVFLEEYFPKQARTVLTYLCTYNEFLPQGAPTSSYISNLIMQDFDEKIGLFCEKNNISYTRYSDDMTFSGDFNVKMVIFKVKDELKKMGMQLNYDKIHVIYSNMSQQVTGITVNEKPQVLKVKRRKIRQEVYYIKKYGLYSHLKRINVKDEFSYLRSLLGKINFVLMVNSEDLEFFKYREFILKIFNNL
ncbi:putative uncharacterized protein [Firmicutes bacterium CAG:822]|nr:putative uncharacterized protein [Firmicutes bacterium CAG:822]